MKPLRIYVDLAVPPEGLQLLREGTRGHELIFPDTPLASVLSKASVDPKFASVEVAFGQPACDAILDAPYLRWVHVSSSGITRYDTPAFRQILKDRGILLSNSASVYNEACADHALSFMLAQSRGLPEALQASTGNGTPVWRALRSACVSLKGQTLLILGHGAIGRRLVELVKPFHMRVMGYRRHCRGDEGIEMIPQADLPSALAQADHVMTLLPESRETQRFFDAGRFATMKRGAVFYNIGRGATVDQEALLQALDSHQISSAWLDVTEPEPLPAGHPLSTHPRCHLTPHIAGGHRDETLALLRHFLDNFDRFIRSSALTDRVF